MECGFAIHYCVSLLIQPSLPSLENTHEKESVLLCDHRQATARRRPRPYRGEEPAPPIRQEQALPPPLRREDGHRPLLPHHPRTPRADGAREAPGGRRVRCGPLQHPGRG